MIQYNGLKKLDKRREGEVHPEYSVLQTETLYNLVRFFNKQTIKYA